MGKCSWYSDKTDDDSMSSYGYCQIINESVDCIGDIGDCICSEQREAEERDAYLDWVAERDREERGR